MTQRQGGTVVVLRHVAFEDLGVLEPVLEARGYRVRMVDACVAPLGPDVVAGADLLIVLGGPIGVSDGGRYPFLVDEKRLVRDWIGDAGASGGRGRPALGICLGAQLIAEALGAAVAPSGRHEIGYAPLTLTPEGRNSVLAGLIPAGGGPDAGGGDAVDEGGPVPVTLPVLHWHGDQFAIPDGAVRLAETPGFPNQAFAVGSSILGLQFHLEADPARIEQWLVGHAVELAAAGADPRRIRVDARAFGSALAERARAVVGRWLDGLPDGSPRG